MIRKIFDHGTDHTTASIGLLILRLGACGFLMTHGLSKLTGFGDMVGKFQDPWGIMPSTMALSLVIVAEFISPILIILGLATRIAAFLTTFSFFSAALIHHHGDPLQKKELAFVYLIVFAAITVAGSGKYGLDRMILPKKPK